MTAVVGILNKHGIAIAADSAVTVNGQHNRKVYNFANKIFTLSKYHPVSIAIYNNAEFLGTPWEVLIKEYRRQIGRRSFETLREYKENFFEWLSLNNFFSNQINTNKYLYSDFLEFLHALISFFIDQKKIGVKEINKNLETLLKEYISVEIPKHNVNQSLKNLNLPDAKKEVLKLFPNAEKTINNHFGEKLFPSKINTLVADAYIAYLTHDQFVHFSGLIFSGFGEKDIFPRVLPVNVSIVIDGNLRFFEDSQKEAIIGDNVNSFIVPFAQTDVIDTILGGISPELHDLSLKVFNDLLDGLLKKTIPGIPGMPEGVIHQLKNIDASAISSIFQKNLGNIIKEKFVNPLMNAVSQLSKEDLAEMAESLVYLTYLKRRFTMAEESVGGPVDVAIITKGDGFIWIKRKHYFEPRLNQNYFQKYYNFEP